VVRKALMLLRRVGAALSLRRRDAQLDVEIRDHLESLTDDYMQRGLGTAEARMAARREFGGIDQMKEAYRDQQGLPWLDALVQDIRYGVRTFRRDRTFSAVAILTLAFGIGVVVAIFGAVKAVLLDPLPYPKAERLVALAETRRDGSRNAGTFGMYRGLAERAHVFESLAVAKVWQPTLTGDGRPERLEGQRVSAAYFDVLKVPPAHGRALQPDDDRRGGPNVVVLSDGLWRRRFAADPSIVGRVIRLDDNAYTVVGVAAAGFADALAPSVQIWSALQYDMSLGSAWGHHLRTIGRLRPDVAVDRASREVDAAGRAVLDEQHPATYSADTRFSVFALDEEVVRSVKPSLVAVMGAVSLVLLIACINVTNLLLARGARRRQEFAMRIALGAGRGRVVRQLLTESLVLAAAGGVLAVVVAYAGVRVLTAFVPAELPRAAGISVDAVVLTFAIAVTSLVGVFVGLVPAFDSLQRPAAATRNVTNRVTTRRVLVVAEVAFAVVLLVTAGLLLHSLRRLFAVSPGFDPSNAVTMQVQTSGRRFDKATTDRFFDRALAAVRDVRGVRAAGFTSQLPLSGDDDEYGVRFEGEDARAGSSIFRYAVSDGYFDAIGIPLRRGRVIDARDLETSPYVAVISESLARRRFGSADPIGRRLHIGPPDAPWYAIVGIVGDVRQVSLAVTQPDAIYIATRQSWFVDRARSLVARVQGDADSAAPAIRDAIWTADKDQPILRIAKMDDLVAASAAARRFALTLFEAFALAAFALAGLGLYGVLAGSVTERSREIAIRSALGASRSTVLGLVVRQGMAITTAGVAVGIGGALAAGRAIATLLFGITPLDPVTYGGVITSLLLMALLSSSVPAWRAVRIDPATALRQE
jgi:putative ABC transport system permease protein